ncbi:ORF6N domain-containing protein [Flavobacterium selenitireducens]|uniref:ORF6N domain-containing protein n=1 Tax=Flavobacterium selenitireducens TaxID=2722704 RepID=UPI00168BEAB7|nr:ORF6N domain-containing protein [Flavobacterium selenitireducens]MBD3582273.1 ORF6N domain-containing protein [Flavobacterium selenitireducens]
MSVPDDPEDLLLVKIQVIRDQKVMLDRDLASLYGVEKLKHKVNAQSQNIELIFQYIDELS